MNHDEFAQALAASAQSDQDEAEALRIAAILIAYGQQLRHGGMPDKLVAALVVQAGSALWGGGGCEDE